MQGTRALTALVVGLAAIPQSYAVAQTSAPRTPEPIRVWIGQLKSTDPLERRRAPLSPTSLGPYRHAAALGLEKGLSSPDAFVRRRVADAIGEYQLEPAVTVAPLVRTLADSDLSVRNHAAIALIKIGPPAVPALVQVIRIVPRAASKRRDADEDETPMPTKQAYAAYVLSKIEPAATQAILQPSPHLGDLNHYESYVVGSQPRAEAEVYRGLLGSANPEVRETALNALEYLRDDAVIAIPDMIRLLKSGTAAEREAAAEGLGRQGGRSAAAVPALIAALEGSSATLRKNAGEALGEISLQPELSVPALIAAFDRAGAEERWWAMEALSSFGPQAAEACPRVRGTLGDSAINQDYVYSAINELCPADEATIHALLARATLGDSSRLAISSLIRLGPGAVSSIVDLYHGGDPEVRRRVIEGLGDGYAPDSMTEPLLTEAVSDPDAAVQKSAIKTLRRLAPEGTAALPALLREYRAKRNMYSIQCELKALGPAALSALPELTAVAADEGTLKAAEQVPEDTYDEGCSVADVFVAIGPASVPFLIPLFDKPYFRRSAFLALTSLDVKSDEVAPAVAELLHQEDYIATPAAEFLASTGPNGLAQIERALRDPDGSIRRIAIDALRGNQPCVERVALIEPLLHDPGPRVRIGAGWSIQSCPGTEGEIAKLREDPDEDVRAAFAVRAEPDPFEVFINESRPDLSAAYTFVQKAGTRAAEYLPKIRDLFGSPDEELALDATRVFDEMGLAEDSKEFRSLAQDAFLATYMDVAISRVQGATDFFGRKRSGRPPPRQLPELPWPVPSPSRLELVQKPLFGTEVHSLGDAYTTLDSALNKAGFTETGIFAALGGIAVVTPVERIREEDMTPFPEPDRWTRGKLPLKEFSLTDYLRSLFLDRPGQFRMFIFLISDRDPELSKSAMTEEQARRLELEGGRYCPTPSLENHSRTSNALSWCITSNAP